MGEGTWGREDGTSSYLFMGRRNKKMEWVLSAVCVTVLCLVQSCHDSQALGNSGILELREGLGSLRLV